jgi:hypothetical protein
VTKGLKLFAPIWLADDVEFATSSISETFQTARWGEGTDDEIKEGCFVGSSIWIEWQRSTRYEEREQLSWRASLLPVRSNLKAAAAAAAAAEAAAAEAVAEAEAAAAEAAAAAAEATIQARRTDSALAAA